MFLSKVVQSSERYQQNMSFGTFFFLNMSSEDASITTLILKMSYFWHLKRPISLIKFKIFSINFDFKYKQYLQCIKCI